MDWATELTGFAIHAVAAVALLLLLRTAPARRVLGRMLEVLAAWSPRKALVVVLLATAGTRGAMMATFEPTHETDVREYVEKARLIADEGSPRAQEERTPGRFFYRPLGWSMPLAGWYRLTGTRGVASARVFGIALACAAAWLLLVLGRTIGRGTEGRAAALGYAGYLPHLVFAVIPYTETFVTVLVLAASVLFERLRRGSGGLAAAAGLGLALGWIAITRTEMAFLLPLAALLLVFAHRPGWTRGLAQAAVACVLFAVPLAVNHEMRTGYPGHLRTSVQGGLILYFGNNPIEVNGHGNATPAVAARVQELYAHDPTGGAATREALAWMRENPLEAVANAPKKLYHLWLVRPQGFGWHARLGKDEGLPRFAGRSLEHVAWVQSLLVLIAGIAGLRVLGPERRLWVWALVLHALVWCVLASSARNRYPLEPWLLLGAAAWVSRACRDRAA